jgi:aminoglycoside phosphotransferase (APT) family kinase protein
MANRMPAAEVDISPDLVRNLIAAQHPDLAQMPVEFLANGWDNTLYRVGDRLIARLPRRELGARIIRNEQRWLRILASALPIPIPFTERPGLPAPGYPWHWSLVPYLPGVPAPAEAPVNPFRGVWVGEREDRFRENLRAAGSRVDEAAALRVWSAAVCAPRYAGPPTWLHGDLHPANILVREGKISGVIDWGDITSGDPACDLAVAWLLLPPSAHETFWSSYGVAGEALRARAAAGRCGSGWCSSRSRRTTRRCTRSGSGRCPASWGR